MSFFEWLILSTRKAGYSHMGGAIGESFDGGAFMNMKGEAFSVFHIKQSVPLETIKGMFESISAPTLVVVDSHLINAAAMNEPWLRALHALYYGRVYAWVGKLVQAVHYDRMVNDIKVWGPVDGSDFYFDTVDSWYKGMSGTYATCRFTDPNFWKDTEPKAHKRQHKHTPPKSNNTEQFWREEFERQKNTNPNAGARAEDVYEAFREAFNQYKQQYAEPPPDPSPRRTYRPTGDQWFNALIAEGSLEGAKKKYRQLALEYHPDRKGDSPEVIETMQLINAAYARVKEILT